MKKTIKLTDKELKLLLKKIRQSTSDDKLRDNRLGITKVYNKLFKQHEPWRV